MSVNVEAQQRPVYGCDQLMAAMERIYKKNNASHEKWMAMRAKPDPDFKMKIPIPFNQLIQLSKQKFSSQSINHKNLSFVMEGKDCADKWLRLSSAQLDQTQWKKMIKVLDRLLFQSALVVVVVTGGGGKFNGT